MLGLVSLRHAELLGLISALLHVRVILADSRRKIGELTVLAFLMFPPCHSFSLNQVALTLASWSSRVNYIFILDFGWWYAIAPASFSIKELNWPMIKYGVCTCAWWLLINYIGHPDRISANQWLTFHLHMLLLQLLVN